MKEEAERLDKHEEEVREVLRCERARKGKTHEVSKEEMSLLEEKRGDKAEES